MKRHSALVLVSMLVLRISPLAAQDRDGSVALPGQMRIDLGAEYLRADARFGADRGSDPWGLDGRLDAEGFEPLRAPAAALDDFLRATGGLPAGAAPVSGADLSAGDLDFDGIVATRRMPVRIAIGAFPRVEVGASIPILLTQRLIRRFGIAEGNVGLNPDVAGNRARLAPIGSAGEAIGGAPLLPVGGSPAGEALQARALAATGGTLALPASPLSAGQLAELYDFTRPAYDAGAWEAGDLEIDARVQLVRSFPGAFPAPSRPLDYRLTLAAAYRFPIDLGAATGVSRAPDPLSGYSGPTLGAVGDLFVGSRLWLTVGGSAARLGRDVDIVPPENPLPGETISLDPLGDSVLLWLQPRVRLTRELSVGGIYELASREGTFVEGTTSSVGLSIRFSNLPAPSAGEAGRPLDAALGFHRPLGGPDGAARTGRAFVQLSIRPRLWGRPAAEVSDPTPGAGGESSPLE